MRVELLFSLFLTLALTVTGGAHAQSRVTPGITSTVTMPLSEYLDLKKAEPPLKFTSIEDIVVSGEYGKILTLEIKGGTSDQPVAMPFFEHNPVVELRNCQGDAVLSLEQGMVRVLPQAKRFQVKCAMELTSWQSPTLRFNNALSLQVRVKGVEPVFSTQRGAREVVLHRLERKVAAVKSAEPIVNEDPSVTAHYKLSVLPDTTSFEYRFSLSNPNSRVKVYTLALVNSETLQSVHTGVTYKESKSGLELSLPPGESSLVLKGSLPGKSFKPMFAKGVEYLLFETHPMLMTEVETEARRINPSDARMAWSYPSPRAYIFERENPLTWTKKSIETFSAATYSVDRADYRYYWSQSGTDLLEANFSINNQGAPEFLLPIQGQPTYLEVNGRPQLLSKKDSESLLVRLPTGGQQRVTVQYKIDGGPSRALASLSDSLERPKALISAGHVTVSVPSDKEYLFVSNGHSRLTPFSAFKLVMALLAFLFLYKFSQSVQIRRWVAWSVSISGATVIFFKPLLLFSLGLCLVTLLLIHHRHRFYIQEKITWRKSLAPVVGLGVLLLVAWLGLNLANSLSKYGSVSTFADFPQPQASSSATRSFGEAGRGAQTDSYGFAESVPAAPSRPSPQQAGVQGAMPVPKSAGAGGFVQDDSYLGLPARVAIPANTRDAHLQLGFLSDNAPVQFTAFVYPSWISGWIFGLSLLMLGGALWLERRRLWAYLHL